MRHQTWLLTAIALLLPIEFAVADGVEWYADGSAAGVSESRLGWRAEHDDLSIGAGMTLERDDDRTRVVPHLSSGWAPSDRLEMDTVLRYGDWNEAAEPFAARIDTNMTFRPSTRYVERILATVRHTRAATRRSLQVSFAPVPTGVSFRGGAPLGLEADLTMNGHGDEPVASRLGSSWGIGETIDVDASLHPLARAWEARVVYRLPLPLFERLEGRLEDKGDGRSSQVVGLGFPRFSSEPPIHGEPLTLSSKAVLTETLRHGVRDALRFGVETRMTGFIAPLVGGRNALSLKLERRFEASDGRASLVYDHSWSPGELSAVDLNFELLGETDALEPSLDLEWATRF